MSFFLSFPSIFPTLPLSLLHKTNETDATEQLIATLSLQPIEGTDVALSNSTHTLKLFGKTVSGGRVASLIKMAFSSKSGVTTKITVRAEEEGVAAAVIASLS